MGDVEKTVKILFQGDDETGSAVKSIKKSLDGLEDAARNVGSGLEDIGAPFADAVEDVALLEAAILAIAAAGLKARSDLEGEAHKMGDALGFPTEKAEEFEGVAKRVYSSGFGGDLKESFEAVTFAAQKFKDETSDSIESIVTDANKIKDTFSIDVAESITTVKQLTDDYGISSKAAFNGIVYALQNGANSSGDLLDSIKEYGPIFAANGADADYLFSVLISGFKEGIAGTDAAGDAFKEFGDKILSNSAATQEALSSLGINAEELNSKLASGEITVAQAFEKIKTKIAETEDQTIQFQAGAELMGEPFIKLGIDAVSAIRTTSISLDDLAGKIDSIKPDEKLGVKFESMMKTIQTVVTSDDVWAGIESDLGEIFDGFKENFVKAWESLDSSDFDGLLKSFDDLMGSVSEMFGSADIDLTTVEGIKSAIQDVIDTVKSINNVSSGIVDFVSPIVSAVSDLIRWFNELNPETQELAGYIAAFGAALGTVGTVLAAGGAVLGGISSLVGAFSSGGLLYAAISGIIALLTGPLGLGVAVGAIGATALKLSFDTDEIDKSTEALEKEIKVLEDFNKQLNELPLDVSTVEIYAALDTGDYDEAQRLIDEAVAHERTIQVDAEVSQDEFNAMVENVNNGLTLELEVDTEPATKELTYWTETEGEVTIQVPVTAEGVDEVKKKVDELPTEKQLEIMIQGDIDKELASIKSNAETAQTAFEWTAKVDIAQAEAAAQEITAAFTTIGDQALAAGSIFNAAFGGAESSSYQARNEALKILESEREIMEQNFELQKKLTEAEVKYMEARTKALESGDVAINISSDGLEPALEMVMWEIIKKVQVKANEEAADFLLGIV
ncbi:phage tail tape measure protein [uncultured Desulfobacter sp.]|uniref:phage tail tape measure protein n=1 Tax=uncultured Desulfobacter sp. TaxID=240139 RepID=UPI0029C6AD5D|nr:phage tail tape measure protein [uncultured Desulfobacter sp.]